MFLMSFSEGKAAVLFYFKSLMEMRTGIGLADAEKLRQTPLRETINLNPREQQWRKL